MLEVDRVGFQLARIPQDCAGTATVASLMAIGGVLKGYDRMNHALVVAVPFTPTGVGIGPRLVAAGVRHAQLDDRAGTAVFVNGLPRLIVDQAMIPIISPLVDDNRIIISFPGGKH